MNGRKESLKQNLNLNIIAYFHVALTNYNTSLLGENVLLKKILDTHLSTRSLILGGVVYAKIIFG